MRVSRVEKWHPLCVCSEEQGLADEHSSIGDASWQWRQPPGDPALLEEDHRHHPHHLLHARVREVSFLSSPHTAILFLVWRWRLAGSDVWLVHPISSLTVPEPQTFLFLGLVEDVVFSSMEHINLSSTYSDVIAVPKSLSCYILLHFAKMWGFCTNVAR